MLIRFILISQILFFNIFVIRTQAILRDAVTNGILNSNQALRTIGTTKFEIGNHSQDLSINNINYDDINGSPFWENKYQKASLYFDSKFITKADVRLNILTDEIHYINDSLELVVDSGIVNKIVFEYSNDTVVFMKEINNLFLNSKQLKNFVQILNFGKFQLIKFQIKKLKTSELFSPNGRFTYYFLTDVVYFIRRNEIVDNIKKLNKESLYHCLPSSNNYTNWAIKNKINFKNEKDVVKFLNYYNSKIVE